ncbi:hypothetical protein B0J11DRAFT_601989 [Dendryphion nanum]|uniref:DUF7703 domain-containing protein n=1 Tax=Dendryphion nanum TaxID=256645 RepID=A0A9P9CYB6_9PLEO|nr:hypothetical protein B0J11DRAFT_601989 [Dendryphion nanum]
MAVGNFLVNGNERPLLYVFVAFASVAIWSTVPLTIRLVTTLKKRSGLYFWSILISSWGLCIRQIGYTAQFLTSTCPWWVSLILGQGGWIAMVTGFNLVLYSRLNLILESYRIRRFILYAILFNGFVWHTTMCTLSSGVAYNRNAGPRGRARVPAWTHVIDSLEKAQIVILSGQEITISLLYIRAAYQYLRGRFAQPGKIRNAMLLLVLVQVIIISLDITLIVIDCAGYLQLKLFTFSFIYSVKLELEFVVLNQLVEISTMDPTLMIPSASSPDLRDVKLEGRYVRSSQYK